MPFGHGDCVYESACRDAAQPLSCHKNALVITAAVCYDENEKTEKGEIHMANAKKVGKLIREARTDAGLTQEQLARKVRDCSASDIGRAERGEKELTTDQLKQVAKATGVTQKSLLDAAKGTSSSASAPKPPAGANTTSMKVTATEKKLVQLYRSADSQTKKEVMATLKGETVETLVGSLIGSAFSALTGKKEMPEDDED